MPALDVLIKPASSLCNLRCSYCFYADVSKNRSIPCYGQMTETVLAQCLEQIFSYATGSLSIAFQGGEPMMAGLPFYQKYLELVERYNTKRIPVHHSLQTNLTLLDEAWVQFFKENHFLLGVSLDGSRRNHDRYRLDGRGEGTFSVVWAGIEQLQRAGIPFTILTVVTQQTAAKLPLIYAFYREHQFDWQQFIPCLDPFREGESSYSLSAEAYGQFLCELFDLWYMDIRSGRRVHNRYFENLVFMLEGSAPELCGMEGVCNPQLVIEADGGVYPCDFYVLDSYCLGNLTRDSLEVIDQRRKTSQFLQESCFLHEDCRGCEWLRLCRGGCRRHRDHLGAGAVREKNRFCEGYKRFFPYALERLQSLVKRI